MDDKTRQQITWLIITALVASIIMVAVYRRYEVDRLLATISQEAPAKRVAAVTRLIEKQKLMEALEDEPRWVQDRAVEAAALVGTEESFFQLVAAKSVVDEPVAAAIDSYLTSVGELSIGPLVMALQDKDAAVRGGASAPLKTIGAPAVDSLMPLIDVYDDAVRGLVATTLGGIGEPAIRPLLRVMQQDEPLPDQGPAAFRRSKSAAEAAFKAMAATAMEPMIEQLLDDEDPDVRLVATGILGTVAAPLEEPVARAAVAPLIERLTTDPAFAVRRRAASALGGLGETALVNNGLTPLIGALSDRRGEVRAAAAQALGTLGDAAAAAPLATLLQTNRSGATVEIADALAKLRQPAVAPLIPALSHPDLQVRLVAAETLAAIGGPDVVVPLGRALSDPEPKVRRAAADALRNLADARVLEPLAAALGDSQAAVYYAARDALARLGATAVPTLITALGSPNTRVAYMAEQALAQIGPAAVRPLIADLLATGGTQAGRWAAIALGKIGDEVVRPAAALLADGGAPPAARAAAARALGITGSFSASESLTDATAAGPAAVREAAVRALGEIEDSQTTSALVAALSDEAQPVREMAMNVLRSWRLGDVDQELTAVLDGDDADAARRAAIVLADHSPAASGELIRAVGASQQQVTGESERVRTLLRATVSDAGVGDDLRYAAITGLTYVGNEASLQTLEPLLAAGNRFAGSAAKAVGRIGQRLAEEVGADEEAPGAARATQLLLTVFRTAGDDETRLIAGSGLAVMGEEPVADLIEQMKSAGDDIRPWIAAILGTIGKPATDPLLDARGREEDPTIKNWYAASLELLGDARALDLIERLPDEEKPDPQRVAAGRRIFVRLQRLL